MAKKKKADEGKKGLDEWMGTYGDLVTLLMCFFVLLFASASTDVGKWEQIAASFKDDIVKPLQSSGMMNSIGNGIMQTEVSEGNSNKEYEMQGAQELEQMAEELKTYFAENFLNDRIEVEQNDDYITINFKDGLLFDSGSATIRDEAIEVLRAVVQEILKYPENIIKIEGHTDNMPINTVQFPNNWYLSAARAISVATFFTQQNLAPQRISTEGYGEYNPKVPNDTPENRSLNRRVEIKIMNKAYDSI